MNAPTANAAMTDQALRLIHEHLARLTGDEFFHALARAVALTLRVRYAIVTEFTSDDSAVRTLAFWADDTLGESAEWTLRGNPRGAMLTRSVRYCSQGAQTRFSSEKWLAKLAAESCVAIPLIDASEHVLGHLMIVHDAPLKVGKATLLALKNLGARATLELERQRAELPWRAREQRLRELYETELAARQRSEEILTKTEEQLTSILGSAMDAIIMMDRRHRITLFNRAAEQVFRCSTDHAHGQRFDRFLSRGFRKLLDEHLGAGGAKRKRAWAPEGVTALRADGEEFPIEVTVSPIEMAQGCFYTIFLRDVHEREKRNRRCAHSAWNI